LANSKNSVNQIKNQIKELEKLSKNIKTPDDIQKILAKVDEIKKNIGLLKDKIKNEKDRLVVLKKQILNDLDEIKKASQNDYKRLASKYDMLKEGKYYEFAQTFLQPEVKKYVEKFLKYYKLIQPYLKKETKENNQYIRSKGTYITYKDKIKYPDFVLEKGIISAKSSDIDAKTEVVNLSSNQILLNKQGIITISAVSKYFKSAMLTVKYLQKAEMDLNVKNIFINKLNAGELVLLNPKINVFSHGNIDNEYYNIVTSVYIVPEKITFASNKYIAKVVQKLKKLNVKILIKGNNQKYNIKITSDIDKLFANYLKEEMNTQIKIAKSKLKDILKEQIKEEISKTGFDANKFNIINDVSSFENSIDSLKSSLNKYTKDQLSKQLLKKGIGDFIKF